MKFVEKGSQKKARKYKRPAFKIFSGKVKIWGHAYLTYFGRSLKVSNFWVYFGPQGRFDKK